MYQRVAIEETKAEKDLSRILPPDKEDLSVDDTGSYGVCVMGQHTVAGVAVAQRRARPQQADMHANRARRHVQAADMALRQARRHVQAADMALRKAHRVHQRQGRSQPRGSASQELAGRVTGAISPQATAQELLRIRAALVTRVS